MDSKTIIYPPIIDNSINVTFVSGEELKIYFWHNKWDSVGVAFSTTVLIQAKINGESIFKDNKPFISAIAYSSEDFSLASEYYIIISPSDFKEEFQGYSNKSLVISLAALQPEVTIPTTEEELINLQKEKQASSWSDSVIKFEIQQTTFSLFLNGVSAGSTNFVSVPLSAYDYKYTLKGIMSSGNQDDFLTSYTLTIGRGDDAEQITENFVNSNNTREFTYDFQKPTWYSGLITEIQITWNTNKGLVVNTLLTVQIIPPEIVWNDGIVFDRLNCSLGAYANTNLSCQIKNNTGNVVTGIVHIERAELYEGAPWREIYADSITLQNNISHEWKKVDLSVESGIKVKYRIYISWEQYTGVDSFTKFYSIKEEFNPILPLFDDCYLMTKDASLRIAYNPKITGMKKNVQDIITPTLGGAYPFVRRNGDQIYRTFQIGGLISYNSDFAGEDQWEDEENGGAFKDSLFLNANAQAFSNKVKAYNDQPYYIREQIRERMFRDLVIDFLYDDQVVLFKSAQEGNLFIRLTNVSLTSEAKLDRNIWSFTAQGTEVMAPSAENYKFFFSDIAEIDSFRDVFALAAHQGA